MNGYFKRSVTFSDGRLSLKFSFVYLLIVLAIKTLLASGAHCDPNNVTTCLFGGTCQPSSSPTVGNAGPGTSHSCFCPTIECFNVGYEPVCGDDSRTYFNNLCRRARECVDQRQINVVCQHECGSKLCEASATNPPPRCAATDRNFCDNFGECLLADDGSKYCKCIGNYEGERCTEVRIRTSVDTGSRPVEDGFDYRLAFLCCLGVLGFVFLLMTVYCAVRCYRSSTKKEIVFDEDRSQDSHKLELGKLEENLRHPRITTLEVSNLER